MYVKTKVRTIKELFEIFKKDPDDADIFLKVVEDAEGEWVLSKFWLISFKGGDVNAD